MTTEVREPITGQQMFDYRRTALSFAVAQNKPTGEQLHMASAYLQFLLNGQPIDEVPGSISGPFSNTPEVLAAAGQVQAATPAKALTKAEKAAAKLAAAPTSVSAETTSSTAPAAVASQPQTAQTAAGSDTTASSPASSSPASIAAPTTIALAAESLKALVLNKTVGGPPTTPNGPAFGRAIAIALLKEFGCEQLSQIPAAKLAEFKARLDQANTGQAQATAADPTGGLLG